MIIPTGSFSNGFLTTIYVVMFSNSNTGIDDDDVNYILVSFRTKNIHFDDCEPINWLRIPTRLYLIYDVSEFVIGISRW